MGYLNEGAWAEPPTNMPNYEYRRCYICSDREKSTEIVASEWNEWCDAHVACEAMLEWECPGCRDTVTGAAFNGRCYPCHVKSLVPYDSGEDYIGVRH